MVGLFLATMLSYWRTAAPEVVAEGDCAEYVCAARVAGIPHAPGFPTYMWLAAGVARLVPAEHLARALNLMSSFFGALTVALLALVASRLARRAFPEAGAWVARGAALAGGLLLAGATEFWNQSLSAEVYTLSTALLALFLERWSASAEPRRWAAAALVAGLAFGVHYNVGVPCALVVAAGACSSRGALAWRGGARMAAAFALGLATFLYLPLRSRADPALDFGDPETPARLWRMLTLADMPTGKAFARELGLLARQIEAVAGLAAQQWPLAVLALCAAGALVCAARRALWSAAAVLGLVFVLDYAGILAMANFAPVDEELYELRFLFLPAYLVLALVAGLGFAGAAAWAERRARRAAPALLAALGLALAPWGLAQARRLDKSDDHVMSEYGRALLREPAGPAVLFTYGDNAWMAVIYQQLVLGLRAQDVAIVAAGLLRHPWYRDQLRRRHPELVLAEEAPGVPGIARANAARAHLYHADPRTQGLRGFQEVPGGLLTSILPEGERVYVQFQSPPEFSPGYAVLDMRERSIRADILQAHARAAAWWRADGDLNEAVRIDRLGLGHAPPVPRLLEFHLARAGLWLELGDALASLGKITEAQQSWASARDEAPGSPPAAVAEKRLAAFAAGVPR